MRVKICGLKRLQDAKLAHDLGASELGLIFAPSPRQVGVDEASEIIRQLPAAAPFVGVFKNESIDRILKVVEETSLQRVQLHGTETPEEIGVLKEAKPDLIIFKVIGVKGRELSLRPDLYSMCDALIFDSLGSHFYPSQRELIDCELPRSHPFYLAGGLNPQNLLSLIKAHRPQGIDLSSGIEVSPGIKDSNLLQEIFSLLKDLP